jgi:hypothetical protein
VGGEMGSLNQVQYLSELAGGGGFVAWGGMVIRVLLAGGLVLTGGVLAQQQVLEVEPNDAPGTAQVIQPGDHVVCSFATTADEDWFAFTLAAPGQVHLRSVNAGTLSLSTTRDTRIALYDATGTQRLAWNDNASGTRADCGVTVPAGSYSWRVSLKTAITAPAVYDLDFFVLPGRTIDVPEGPEPNDPSQPGWAPTVMTLGQTVEGELATPSDIDWWGFTLPNRGYVQCVSFDDGGVPQLDNMGLRFYHEATPGTWVPLGAGNATNSASHRVSSLTHTGLLSAGSYAVAVMAGTVATSTAPWDYVKAGRHSLRTTFVDMHGAAAIPEAPEPNSSTATAAFLTLGFDVLGSAQAGNDRTGTRSRSRGRRWSSRWPRESARRRCRARACGSGTATARPSAAVRAAQRRTAGSSRRSSCRASTTSRSRRRSSR